MPTSFPNAAPYYVKALLSGSSWTGTVGKEATIPYSFLPSTMVSLPGINALNTMQQTSVLSALTQWENVANIDFVRNDSSSTALYFEQALLGNNIAGVTYMTNALHTSFALIAYHSSYLIAPAKNAFSYTTVLHEIGHALGLKHPGNYNGINGSTAGPYLPRKEDNFDTSIMSYHSGLVATASYPPTSPMIYDIAAVQYLYGANKTYNADNTSYSLTGSKDTKTLWDGGGQDTLDASQYTKGSVLLDLREGAYNISIVGEGAYWIAFNAAIENALGGTGNDKIYGNALNNVLAGNQGNDTLFGGMGNDALYGNKGNDTINGNKGNDTLFGGMGNDVFVYSIGSDNDVIYAFDNPGPIAGDLIQLPAALGWTPAMALSHITYSGKQATIVFSATDSLTVLGVNANSPLTAQDFTVL